MGGGFGGCTINLIKNENKKDFINFVGDEFYKIYKYELDSEEVIFSNGASIIWYVRIYRVFKMNSLVTACKIICYFYINNIILNVQIWLINEVYHAC